MSSCSGKKRDPPSRKKNVPKQRYPSLKKWFSPVGSPSPSKFKSSSSSPVFKSSNYSSERVSSKKNSSISKFVTSTPKSVKLKSNQNIVNLLEAEAQDDSLSRNRYSLDSHLTQIKSIENVADSNRNQLGQKATIDIDSCSAVAVDEHKPSAFGLVRLKPIPPKLLDPQTRKSCFKQKKLNPMQRPIQLKENDILGRSIEHVTPGKRIRNTIGNKLNLGIPITANGISRKHLKVIDVRIRRKVTFQVMDGVKNEIFVLKNGIWIKPEMGCKFDMQHGDYIVFDVYEWSEGNDAQYAFELVQFENAKPIVTEIINLYDDGDFIGSKSTELQKKRKRALNNSQDSLQKGSSFVQTVAIEEEISDINSLTQHNKDQKLIPSIHETKKSGFHVKKTTDKTSVIKPLKIICTQPNAQLQNRIKRKLEKADPNVGNNGSDIHNTLGNGPNSKISKLRGKEILAQSSSTNKPLEITGNLALNPPVITPDDENKLTKYDFHNLRHLNFCFSTKFRKVGIECSYCFANGNDSMQSFRLFPSSCRILRSSVKSAHNHYRQCSKFPIKLLEELEKLEASKLQQYTKVKPSDEDIFYQNLWKRLQDAQNMFKNKYYDEINNGEKCTKRANEDESIVRTCNNPNECNDYVRGCSNLCKDDKNVKKEYDLCDIESEIAKCETFSIGDRVAVKLNGPDLFCTSRENHSHWYFAIVKDVKGTSTRLQLDLQYDDETREIIDVEEEEVLKLKMMKDGALLSEKTHKNGLKVGYNLPTDLCIGDIVEARYQNRKKWYRGRIAKVNDVKNTCHVAYYDGDYELDIPIDLKNVRLVQRGWANINWLIDQKIKLSCQSNKTWIVTKRSNPDEKAKCANHIELELCHEGKFVKYSFEKIAHKLFASLFKIAASGQRLKQWVSISTVSEKSEENKPSIIADDSSRENINQEFESLQPSLSDSCVLERKNLISPGSSPVRDEDTESRSSKNKEDKPCPKPRRSLSVRIDGNEMLVSQSNSLWRAISSTEPQIGHGLLYQAAVVFRSVPNQFLEKSLHNSIVNGLKSEGIRLVDPNKSELTCRYSNLIHNQFSDIRVAFPSWAEVECCLSLPSKIHQHKCGQVAEELLEAAFAIEYVATRLYRYLFDKTKFSSVKSSTSDTQLNDDSRSLKNCFESSCAIREKLKTCTKWTAKTWLLFGEDILCTSPVDCKKSEAASRCLKALGTVTAIIAEMFCEDENIEVGDKNCCFLIRDIFQSEILKSDVEAKERTLIRNLKLSFISSMKIQSECKLICALGDAFDLRDEVAIIMGV